jgi:peptidoglycan/xylan/chitin deacetylase (PgdA/CDA1 family)
VHGLRRVGAADRPAAALMVALTYDDGPDEDATAAILDVLERRGVRATFFVFGRRDTTRTADLILDEVGGGVEADSVILMHDVPEGPRLTAGLLDRIASRGWRAGPLPA